MTVESFLEKKLQQFSIIDFVLVKSVYFFIGLMFFALYPKLSFLDWWFYLILTLMCSIPLWIHLCSQPGNIVKKMHGYLKTNDLPNQVLLFLGIFFFALMLGVLFPFIVTFNWWYYLVIAIFLAIKPLTVTWFW